MLAASSRSSQLQVVRIAKTTLEDFLKNVLMLKTLNQEINEKFLDVKTKLIALRDLVNSQSFELVLPEEINNFIGLE